MPRKTSISVCSCCRPCGFTDIFRCNHAPFGDQATYLAWRTTAELLSLDCLSKAPAPRSVQGSGEWLPPGLQDQSAVLVYPNHAGGGDISVDVHAKSISVTPLYVPTGSRGMAALAINTFSEGKEPAGSDLAQSFTVGLYGGRISATVFADAIRFEHGASVQTAGTATIFEGRITVQQIVQGPDGKPAVESVFIPGSNKPITIRYAPNSAAAIFGNTFWALGGNVLHSLCRDYPTNSQSESNLDAQASLRDYWVCRFRLSLGEQERLWMPDGGYESTVVGFGSQRLLDLAGGFNVASANGPYWRSTTLNINMPPRAAAPTLRMSAWPNEDSQSLLVTAYARANDDSLQFPSVPAGGNTGIGIIYDSGRDGFSAQPGYTNAPIRGLSYWPYLPEATIYRDGEFVGRIKQLGKAREWISEEFQELTEAEGAYLIIGDDSLSERDAIGFPVVGGPMFSAVSFVVDTTPPIGVVKQVNDVYVGDPTEILADFADDPTLASACLHESEPCTGPRVFVGNFDESRNARQWPVGEYAQHLAAPRKDRAGNVMGHTPGMQMRVHSLPPEGSGYGASAVIELPFNKQGTLFRYGAEFLPPCNSQLYDAPLASVRVRFTHPVTGLSVEHFSLQVVSEATGWQLEERDIGPAGALSRGSNASEYTLALPSVEQQAGSVFYLTFDPALAGPIRSLDDEGEPITKEVCRLASRTMWGVLHPYGTNRDLIDTQSVVRPIGGVSSVTESFSTNAEDDGLDVGNDEGITVASSDCLVFGPNAGRFSAADPPIGFSPRVPPHAVTKHTDDVYGFFGIETSIYPSPPASVPPCSAPSSPQPHSSAICSSEEIVAWEVSFDSEVEITESSLDGARAYATSVGANIDVEAVIRHYTSEYEKYIGPAEWSTSPEWTEFPQSRTNFDQYAIAGASNFKASPGAYYWQTNSMTGGSVTRPTSMTFAASIPAGPYACQQNVWALTNDSMRQGWLYASRNASVCPGLQTAFLHRLTIGVKGYAKTTVTQRGQASYSCKPVEERFDNDICNSGENGGFAFGGGEYVDLSGEDHNWSYFALGPYVITPEDELLLASGSPVRCLETFGYRSKSLYWLANDANLAAPPNVSVFLQRPSGAGSEWTAAHNFILNSIQWIKRYYAVISPIFDE